MDRPLTLAIENSNPSSDSGEGDAPGVALGRVGQGGAPPELLGVELLRPRGRHDDDLMSAIDRLARRTGIEPSEIGLVAVSAGPGGYTALRIAIATAKMIAEATGAWAVAVPTAAIAARLTRLPDPPVRFVVALASKAETAYLTIFGPDRKSLSPGRVVQPRDFASMVTGQSAPQVLVCDEFIPKEFTEIARQAGVIHQPLRLSAIGCLETSFGLTPVDAGDLAPIYAREPEAVTLWRTRKS